MATYRTVSLSFWEDNKIVDDFTPEDRYFYLYLLTNPHTNIIGCYEVSLKQMSNETGYNQATITKLINRMQKIHQVIIYSKNTKEVLIKNWYKYNWTKSEKLLKNIDSEALKIKDKDFKNIVLGIIDDYKNDRVYIGYTYPMDTSVTVTDTDTDNKVNNRFKKPTLEEIKQYCEQRNNNVDAKKFYEYYTIGNWKDKDGKQIKNWKQKVITWEGRDTNKKTVEKDVPVWFNKEIKKEDLLTDEERAWIESIK